MAHEIVHLLLGAESHSDLGLMRGQWSAEDLRMPSGACLGLSAHAVESIRTGVARRIRKILDLMGFGEHREAVHDGIERQRTGGAFKTAFDQHPIERRRQLIL